MTATAQPFAAPAEELCAALGVDPERGLSPPEAARRLAADGPNELERPRGPAYVTLAVRQLLDPLVILLLAAAAVSAAVGEEVEAAAIGAIVVLNAVFGFLQEAGAERAVLALRESESREATVIREGERIVVPAREVVRGDLLVVHEGDRVPADARLVASHRLEVDESALTGESLPVEKTVAPTVPHAHLAERTSLVHAGTAVTGGRATAVVVATGAATEMGAIAQLVGEARPPATPLQQRLGRLARGLVGAGVAITIVLFLGMLAHGAPAREAFLVGVAVAVAAVPEGLAATVTIALALGAREMAARGAIVRQLSAIETLGGTTIICTDKTGTLTQNRLELSSVLAVGGASEQEVLEAAVLASSPDAGGPGGDAVERALLAGAAERGVDRDGVLRARRYVTELPFDPDRKRMTVVWDEPDARLAFTKGAPEVLLRLGARGQEGMDDLERATAAAAAQGLRVLGVARHAVAEDTPETELERELELIGLVVFHDPLREAAPRSVRAAQAAGVKVAMVTGDHPSTARALGAELGLPAGAIFARVTPADKLALVERLQGEGEVVAMTGDGVNDSPALRRADVGLAMGLSGTEAAREAAAIVITDDDFATIVAATAEGRRVSDNIRKFVAFLLSANIGEVALFAAAVLGGLGAPMGVAQVLTVNLLTDGLPALALARDPATPELMSRGPFPRGPLLERRIAWALLAAGAAVGAAGLAAYVIGRTDEAAVGRTMAFATIALAELVFVFACRSPLQAAWRGPRNPLLLWSVFVSAALVAVTLFVSPVRALLGTEPLDAWQLGIVAALALAPAVLVELAKAVARVRRARGAAPR